MQTDHEGYEVHAKGFRVRGESYVRHFRYEDGWLYVYTLDRKIKIEGEHLKIFVDYGDRIINTLTVSEVPSERR